MGLGAVVGFYSCRSSSFWLPVSAFSCTGSAGTAASVSVSVASFDSKTILVAKKSPCQLWQPSNTENHLMSFMRGPLLTKFSRPQKDCSNSGLRRKRALVDAFRDKSSFRISKTVHPGKGLGFRGACLSFSCRVKCIISRMRPRPPGGSKR